ncbi:lipase secretion chaperone [Marinobacter sp. TBZ242]|uniref:Lipase chaperone n=1 Tax=Marinobacter azerbaijanicus TaxID=3050455 RepID=A0ABT7IB87_9GAMM|nr:lipase secretion chaperone [Marinobacter sp. TBZ242]MDL0431052.1 lipase secretion chaperone [Marinobacter sp. TBZ242]
MKGILRYATVALLVMAGVFAGTVILLGDEPAGPSGDAATSHTSVGVVPEQDLAKVGQAPSALVGKASVAVPEGLPASLAGTTPPDGWARTDSHGSLVPTPQLRQLFEYYLAALGEETLPQLVARIQQVLEQLEEPARSDAMAILGDYLDYKLALGELEASYGNAVSLDAGEMQRRMEEIRALRRTWMDARTANAFFANDEALDQFQVEKLRIRTDPSLSDEERQQSLARAEQALPAPVREARRETRKFSDYQQARSEFADDPEALRAWREKRFGEEGARQLEKVEAEQRAWENRWQAYSQELAELEDLGLVGPEREAAIDLLRDEYFEGAEKLRAEALDSIR